MLWESGRDPGPSRSGGERIEDDMSRSELLNAFTIRSLRIYGRKNGVAVRQCWTKTQLVAAIVAAGK